jgi:O-antigen/teichoic acid export membrane protein
MHRGIHPLSTRKLTIQALLLASGRLITAFATVLITGILTRTLDVSVYATHRQVLLLAAIALPLLTLGLPKAPFYFLADAPPERARGVVIENLGALAALGVGFGLFVLSPLGPLWTDRFNNPALDGLVWLLLPYSLGWFPVQSLAGVLVPLDRAGTLMLHNVVTHVFLLVGVGVAAFTAGTAEATLGVYSAWGLLAGLWGVWLMWRATPKAAKGLLRWGGATLSGLRAQLKFAVPLGLATLLTGLSTQLDKYLVGVLCSDRDFAVYVTGAIEVPLVAVVTGAIASVVLPAFTLHHKAGAPQEIVRLWQGAMRTSMLFLAPVLFGVLLLGPDIAQVLFGADYIDAARPMRIYALMLPLRAAVYGSVLMATGNSRWITVSAGVGLALNAVLSWVAVIFIGADGAAWASVLSTYGVVAVMLWPMGRALNVAPRKLIAWRANLLILAVAGLPALALWPVCGLFAAPGLVRLLLVGTAYSLTVAAIYQFSGIAPLRTLKAALRNPGGPTSTP